MTAHRTRRGRPTAVTTPMTTPRLVTPRMVVVALLVGVTALAAASGCSAGLVTQTAAQVPPIPGANASAGRNGQIALRDLLVAYIGPRGYPTGGAAPLVVRIFNNGLTPVRLTGVSAGDAARAVVLVGAAPARSPSKPATTAPPPVGPSPSATAAPTSPTTPASASPSSPATPTEGSPPQPSGQANFSLEIAPSSYLLLVPGQGPYLMLTGLTRPLTPGTAVTVTFSFDDGTSAVVVVPLGVPLTPVPRVSVAEHAAR